MEIKFQTKEQSNQQQEEAFLKLSGGERMLQFFKLSAYFCSLPRNQKEEPPTKNFILEKKQ